MLYELEVLEVRRIADLALELRKVRDQLLENVPEKELGEPPPARGEHNPGAEVPVEESLQFRPEFIALRDAIAELPREIRQKLWAVREIGRGRFAARQFEQALAAAEALSDAEIAADLLGEPDLHEQCHKGLYALGAAELPGDQL
jgi:hypothetical protein